MINTCDICREKRKVKVLSSRFYCDNCIRKNIEPYNIIVISVSCIGEYPDDISNDYVIEIKNILKVLKISNKKFIKDIDKINKIYNEWR
jgi:hypothetical protein